MIDTYMDRCDAANWRSASDNKVQQLFEDPRYWNRWLYDTVIDRQVAKARALLKWQLLTDVSNHKHEIRQGVRVGSAGSLFESNGRMRRMWLQK